VPVAVILMASEMTGSYTLLVPSMIATAIAFVITTRHTIYKSQLPSRAQSPAHRSEFSTPLLEKLVVSDAMKSKFVLTAKPDMLISMAADTMKKKKIRGLPVTNLQEELVGIITFADVLQINPEQRGQKPVSAVMTKEVVVAYPEESLTTVLEKFNGNQIGRMPVVNRTNKKQIVGIITREDVWRVYVDEANSLLGEE